MNNNYNCKHCQHKFKGNYCNKCGQKVLKKRLDIRFLLTDLLDKVFNIKGGLVASTIALAKNPAAVSKQYIYGNTKQYFNPFKYLLLFTAIITFLAVNVGAGLELNTPELQDTLQEESNTISLRFIDGLNAFSEKHRSIVFLLALPFYALLSFFLFKTPPYNFAEHLIFYTYILGFLNFLLLLFLPLISLVGYYGIYVSLVFSILSIIYFVAAILRFFNGKRWQLILKGFLTFVITDNITRLIIFGIYLALTNQP